MDENGEEKCGTINRDTRAGVTDGARIMEHRTWSKDDGARNIEQR